MKKLLLGLVLLGTQAEAAQDLNAALRRAQYLLNGTMPTDAEFQSNATSDAAYRAAVRTFLDGDGFYDSVLRYHERVLGVGLPEEYLQELLRDDIDGKQEKFASITCGRLDGANGRFRCIWTSNLESRLGSGCPLAAEQPVSVFWYPGIVAWACPSIVNACGQDLNACFIESPNEAEARNAELGTTETFDSRYAVIRSLSRQAAGLATAVAVQNYPYTKILESGLTAVDGAVAHFYGQQHHFKISELNLNQNVVDIVQKTAFTDTRFRLLKTGYDYSSGGILSTFGWLRRYDKNRTRANELYKRLLCREFTADLPKVFPQDPGNLRVAPGCSGCHSTLDPLADFFLAWGEGGDLYSGGKAAVETSFIGKTGSSVADLATILHEDKAFATCTVQNVWKWLMGRKFYVDEKDLRSKLTDYFLNSDYSFRELVYAISTHPAFMEGTRSDGIATDPLEAPPLGQFPTTQTSCVAGKTYTFAADVDPYVKNCTGCHSGSGSRQPLRTEAEWLPLRATAIKMMASGVMPPGPATSEVMKLKDAVTCWLEQSP